jgi:uncharacterized protein YndB with AHSA1/START domain
MATIDKQRIERQITLRAPLSRVWQAIADSRRFGAWFGVAFDGPFVEGALVKGVLEPTKVDEAIAERQRLHEGAKFEITIERIVPERLFSFRWHPYAVDPGVDYSSEPTTLIEFALEERDGRVIVTVTESGFEKIPLERRAKAFEANENGWTAIVMLLEKYLAQTS